MSYETDKKVLEPLLKTLVFYESSGGPIVRSASRSVFGLNFVGFVVNFVLNRHFK